MKDHRLPVGISGSTLKMIAIVTMFIDHLGATVLREILNTPAILNTIFTRDIWVAIYSASRSIGRIAFPIFCFLIVEGFVHTRNVWKYASRLFLFALISEIPFDIALKGNFYFPQKQNVYFTLLIGLLVLIAISWCERILKLNDTACRRSFIRHLLSLAVFAIAVCLIIKGGMELAGWIDTDYSYKGIFLIAILYLLHRSRLYQCAAGAAGFAWELPASLSFIPIFLYNGTRGRQMKYFFYWFYPVHLMLLYGIAEYVIPLF